MAGALSPRWLGTPPPGAPQKCGLRWLNEEALPLHEALCVHVRCGSAEETQNQVMVCVVQCIPDRYVLEQTAVCAQDVVSTGEKLPSPEKHAPCPDVPQPRLAPWEEVPNNFLKNHMERAVAISFSCTFPSGAAKLALQSTATSSVTPQGRCLMAEMTTSMVEASSGAKYNSTIYHLYPLDTSWKLTTFGPWRQSDSTEKFSAV